MILSNNYTTSRGQTVFSGTFVPDKPENKAISDIYTSDDTNLYRVFEVKQELVLREESN